MLTNSQLKQNGHRNPSRQSMERPKIGHLPTLKEQSLDLSYNEDEIEGRASKPEQPHGRKLPPLRKTKVRNDDEETPKIRRATTLPPLQNEKRRSSRHEDDDDQQVQRNRKKTQHAMHDKDDQEDQKNRKKKIHIRCRTRRMKKWKNEKQISRTNRTAAKIARDPRKVEGKNATRMTKMWMKKRRNSRAPGGGVGKVPGSSAKLNWHRRDEGADLMMTRT